MAYKSTPVDNIIALRLLTMLCTPFTEFPAYKSGVIDKNGKYIIKPNKRTPAQKRTLTYLDKLLINVKKMINKLPGGENKLKNIISAMVLIKECVEIHQPVELLTEDQLTDIVNGYNTGNIRYQQIISLWCDYIKEKEIREEMGAGAISGGSSNGGDIVSVPTNNTSGIAMTQLPLRQPLKDNLFRRTAFMGVVNLNKDQEK